MTNREWLAKYLHVTDVGAVYNYMIDEAICFSSWHNGRPSTCPLGDNSYITCMDCFNIWLEQDYHGGIECLNISS